MKRATILAIAAAGIGVSVWVVIARLGGHTEAWDSDLYWIAGIPLLCVAAGTLAWIEPRGAWRWAVIPFAAQFLWMVATEPMGPLAPLGLAYMAMLSLPALAVALVVAALRPGNDAKPSGE